MDVIDLLANDNYIIANKTVAKTYGLEEAILLGELASEYKYWVRREELKDGYFYSTIENVKENTTLSDKRQRSALTTLKEAGIVEVKLMGIPAKRYIKIHVEQLFPLLLNNECQNSETSFAKTAELEQPKKQTNNNNLNNNKKSNENNNIAQFDKEFEELWKLYPRKIGKPKALKAYQKARKAGVPYEDIETGIKAYNEQIKSLKTDKKYIKHGSTWFMNECWNDEYGETDKETPKYELKGGVSL
jgi:hypothetical protein